MTNAVAALADALPDYQVDREIGRGAMGVVYLGRHQSLDRLVAIKELPASLAIDPATRSRFAVEARVLAALNHPHIVPVYDYVERDGQCLLIMEQLPGGTVWERFTAQGLTLPQATAITLATCSAMQHAHEQGVLHRDIKPENLMFDRDGLLKVTDFGIARVINGSSTKATIDGSVLGTPAYMAPEQAEGRELTARADVYATGTMLYEMLSGRLPFEGGDTVIAALTQRITQNPRSLVEVAPHVPPSIAAVAMLALTRDPADRFPTAVDFGVALAAAAVAEWGSEWLDAGDIAVRGSERISRAAVTLQPSDAIHPVSALPGTSAARQTVVPGTTGGDPDNTPRNTGTGTTGNATIVPGEMRVESSERPGTVVPGTPPPSAIPPTAATAPVATPTATPASASASTAPVKPQSTNRDVGRAKDISVADLVDIAEVTSPPSRPLVQYAIAAAFFAIGLIWALAGGGTDDTTTSGPLPVVGLFAADGTIDVDLDGPIEVTTGAADSASLSFSTLGIPLGSVDATSIDGDSATFDAGLVPRLSSGSMTAELAVTTSGATTIGSYRLTATNPWFMTVAGILGAVVALFALAGVESNLRSLRRTRARAGTSLGLIMTGAAFGASAAALATIVLGVERGPVAIIGPAAFCAAGAFSLGLATSRTRRRRRVARRTARRAAAKRLAA